MDSTALVAALGLISTLVATWFSASWQRRASREDRMLEARVRIYGECATALYEYERLTYKRAKTRLDALDVPRYSVTDPAYQANSRVNASIGQVALISGGEDLMQSFQAVRTSIQAMGRAHDHVDLSQQQEKVLRNIETVLESARTDLAGAPKQPTPRQT